MLEHVLTIAFGILIPLIIWFIVTFYMPKIYEYFKIRNYRRKAKRRNEKSRQLRLARKDWEGLPLPTGKKGVLDIYEKQWIDLPVNVRKDFESILRDRGRDLGVKIEIFINHSALDPVVISVRWTPDKDKKPKEVY